MSRRSTVPLPHSADDPRLWAVDCRASTTSIEKEIQAEKAAALARIAGTLEALIARLAGLAEQVVASPESERSAVLAEHRVVREQALLYRWYLEVQREAVGLTHHEALDELYPIPAALSASTAGGSTGSLRPIGPWRRR